jgi:hypothetical protein
LQRAAADRNTNITTGYARPELTLGEPGAQVDTNMYYPGWLKYCETVTHFPLTV